MYYCCSYIVSFLCKTCLVYVFNKYKSCIILLLNIFIIFGPITIPNNALYVCIKWTGVLHHDACFVIFAIFAGGKALPLINNGVLVYLGRLRKFWISGHATKYFPRFFILFFPPRLHIILSSYMTCCNIMWYIRNV